MMAVFPALMIAAAVAAAPTRIDLKDARVAPTDAGGSVALSALVFNPAPEPVTIVGASSPLAGQTVLQRYVKDSQGLIQLQAIERLPLPGKSETVLAPGAMELQLVGVTQNLEGGLELPLTIKFDNGTSRVFRVRVQE
ncbi:MAG: copper chaperone PCu(A)C [Alphaproteobacteria bacterium]|nr:MAG: copper chaperone PCu(A)C [Alphaproteobacteria bacterium]